MATYKDYKEIEDSAIGGGLCRYTGNTILTGSILQMAEKMECFWLLDTVVSYLPEVMNRLLRATYLEVKLTVQDHKAVFTISSLSGKKPIVKQEIGFTDLPDDDGKEAVYSFWIGAYDASSVTMFFPSER